MKRLNDRIFPLLLLLPSAAIMLVLVAYPIVRTFFFSLQRMKLTAPDRTGFAGLGNYLTALRDSQFWYSLGNSLFLLAVVTVLTLVLGFAAALLLSRDTRLSGVLMGAAILPWALPPYVNGVLWRFIFYPGYGYMNRLLLALHLVREPVQWLTGRWTVLSVVALVASWRSVPFCAVVILAALKSMPEELRQAALIDGAGRRQLFRYIILPLIVPFVGVAVTHTSIAAINIFDEIVALSGYSDISSNLLVYDYLRTFSFLDIGLGSAVTYLVMLLSAGLGYFYLRSMYREVDC